MSLARLALKSIVEEEEAKRTHKIEAVMRITMSVERQKHAFCTFKCMQQANKYK